MLAEIDQNKSEKTHLITKNQGLVAAVARNNQVIRKRVLSFLGD